MLVGQNPGVNEDLEGRPFIGAAGRYLDSLLFQCGINREDVFISNRVHCKTPNNRELQSPELKACAKWLDLEVSVVQPEIIVAMGSPAIRHFLGNDAGTIEHLHGKPIEKDGRIILPSYHPAAALHDTSKLRQCAEDFQVLRGLVKGTPPSAYHVVNEYPNPVYRVADTPKLIKQMEDEIHDAGEFAIDTEQCRGRFWSAQISAIPGTAWFIPIPEKLGTGWRMDVAKYDATCIVHYYLHEIKYLKIDDDRFIDTMTQSYLVGQPQGLKELAYRLCGIPMQTYTEMVHPQQLSLSTDYLKRTLERTWPDPPAIEETKWDNKKGAIVTRNKHPWHISRKIANIMKSTDGDDSPDPWGKWRTIPPEERLVVESVLGPMPEASLMDIPIEEAVQYSARDADSTLRVYHKLSKLIDDLGLNLVQHVDHGVLPMVNAMMANGMPVDIEHYKRLSEEYDIRLRVQAAELAGMVGHPFNPNSSDQVAAVVYHELGFKPTKMTDSGKESTDDAELKKTGPHPVAKGIIRYRGVLKLKTTYADNIMRSPLDAEGNPRMHTKLNTTRVETGRLSSSKTEDGEGGNLQNIPTRSKDGKDIKNGFCAPDGKLLLEGDYCLPPETRVLTDDYRWIPLRDVIVGQQLIGLTEKFIKCYNGRGYKRVFCPSTVESTAHVVLPCVSIQLSSGKTIVSSLEHPWLARRVVNGSRIRQIDGTRTSSKSWGWIASHSLQVDDEIARLVQPWDMDKTWGGGFLAGAFDGEGCISVARGNVLQFTQSMNPLLIEVCHLLSTYGFKFHDLYTKHGGFPGSGDVCSTWICNNNEIMRFLGTFRPPRLLSHCAASRLLFGKVPGLSGDRIVSIKHVGEQPLISIQTSSHTFFAEGLATHNSQVEMVSQAHLANCKGLIELFNRGGDPHTETAARLFSIPLEEAAQSKYRYPCKRAGFGIIYLIGAQGLATQINEYIADLEMAGEPIDIEAWDETTCQKFIDDYYKLYPEIRDYQLEQQAHARRYGYTRDIIGRIRYIPEISCPIQSISEAGGRMAANFPVTSSAQAIIKAAMGELWRELPKTPWKDVKELMQIHDSLISEIRDDPDYYKPYVEWKRNIMCNIMKLRVPIKVDFKIGKRWGGLKKPE
jgi:uracil-DNA glycosylase family 4